MFATPKSQQERQKLLMLADMVILLQMPHQSPILAHPGKQNHAKCVGVGLGSLCLICRLLKALC